MTWKRNTDSNNIEKQWEKLFNERFVQLIHDQYPETRKKKSSNKLSGESQKVARQSNNDHHKLSRLKSLESWIQRQRKKFTTLQRGRFRYEG